MDLSQLSLIGMMEAKMKYLSERQALLAQNVANADTPDYVPMDLVKPDFKRMVMHTNRTLPMWATQAGHIQPRNNSETSFKSGARGNFFESKPSGNKVALEEEIQKVALVQSDYTMVTNLYRKTVDMYKTALGRPSNG